MENLMKILAEIFEPEIYLKISSNRNVTIRENKNVGKSGSLVELTIEKIPANSIAFALDFTPTTPSVREEMIRKYGSECFDKLSWPIRHKYPEVNKKCDFVIISLEERVHRILIGELKSSLDWDRHQTQLNNSRKYVEYVFSLIRDPLFHKVKMEYNSVVFANSKGEINDSSSTKSFYEKQLWEHKEKQTFPTVFDPFPIFLEAQSGKASCEYEFIVGSKAENISHGQNGK